MMSFRCELKEITAQPTLSIRTKTSVEKLPQLLGKGYGEIVQYLGQLNEQPLVPPIAI